jgi:superfamily II DNA or RNA helicase
MQEKSLQELNIGTHYSTNRNDLIEEFYSPCAMRSIGYDRAVGYFRNSIMILVRKPIAAFARQGGQIRLICSPDITENEVRSFRSGYAWRNIIDEITLATIEKALRDDYEGPIWRFIATLIACNNLEVRIAFRPGQAGIFHDKLGIFRDSGNNYVSFVGSGNETLSAWDLFGNHESFEVFCSWSKDHERVTEHIAYFERLWNNLELGVETIPFPKVARERLIIAADSDGVEAAFNKVPKKEGNELRKVPRLHQVRALSRWKENGYSGILAHATGSGKTYTGLLAIEDWVKNKGPVIILVPSELLLFQWLAEIQVYFGNEIPSVMVSGAGSVYWMKPQVVEGFTQKDGTRRITISTIQTASQFDFLNRIVCGNHLLIVWDEVHWAGAPTYSQILKLNAGGKLGLSATPKRYGDPEGTQKILDYFGGVVDTFSLAEAIESGSLCRYNYYVHPVHLSDAEGEEWNKLTKDISRNFSRLKPAEKAMNNLPEYLKQILIKRARIVKKAHAKVELAAKILKTNFSLSTSWLVYCDDQEQMGNVAQAIRDQGLTCSEYFSEMNGDREATLGRLNSLGGIVVAIKCLDEGVNIPSLTSALILASSKNPREYIQRRGRILRFSPGKHFAEIHDALVIPPAIENAEEPMGANLIKTELARAIRFSQSASNRNSLYELFAIADKAGLKNVDDLADSGTEEG